MGDIVQIISAVGFPIVAAVGCAYFVKWQYEQNHKEEVANMTKAIENNTLALTRLIEKIDKE